MRGVKKQHLPQKTCAKCKRPFVWRKKWAKNWDEIKYCSKRCKIAAKSHKRQGYDRE